MRTTQYEHINTYAEMCRSLIIILKITKIDPSFNIYDEDK